MPRRTTHWERDERGGRGRSRHPGEMQPRDNGDDARRRKCPSVQPDVWDVFDLGDETSEPEPEYGDFWLESSRIEDVC